MEIAERIAWDKSEMYAEMNEKFPSMDQTFTATFVSVDNANPMLEARKTFDGGDSRTSTHIVIAAY